MASINYAAREITVKVVYYGPGLSGKTTNLQVIHRKTPNANRSDMVSLATETDRTLFFDYLPLDLGKIKGFSTKFQLYTVPGQVYYNATRKLVLRGVDGIVFVADSSREKMDENLESFQNLEDNLAEYGYQRDNIPLVMQFNKRDLPDAVPVEELNLKLNKYDVPWNEAVANRSQGVFESLKVIGKEVLDFLNKKYSRQSGSSSRPSPAPSSPPPQTSRPAASPQPSRPSPAAQARPAAAAPQQQRPSPPPPSPQPRQVPPAAQQRPPHQPSQPQSIQLESMADTSKSTPPQFSAPPREGQKKQAEQGFGRTDLDMEIERYRQEIERKQRETQSIQRQQQAPSSPPPPSGPAPTFQPSGQRQGYQQPAQSNQGFAPASGYSQQQQYPQQAPQQSQQGMGGGGPSMDTGDYSVYEVEPPPSSVTPHAPPSAQRPAHEGDDDKDDTMYFTSVDRNNAKRPRRPVNPKSKPRKGFFSKLFNRDEA